MNANDIRTLIDYHYWARDRVLAAVGRLIDEEYKRPLGSSFASIHHTLVHTYSAEWAWHSRWVGVSPTEMLPFDDYPDVATLQAAWHVLEEKVRGVVDAIDDAGLARECDYRLLSGQPGRSTFAEMIQHMVNHASYHRGQVTTMLRQIGAAPGESMDMIRFFRERRAAADRL